MGITGIIFVLASLTVAGGPPAPPSAPIVDGHHPHQTVSIPAAKAHFYIQEASERAMLADLNAVRTAHGLAPFVFDPHLCEVARAHAQDMLERGYFGHISPDGKSPADRLVAAHVPYRTAGENISYQSHTVGLNGPSATDDEKSAQQGLYDSPPHRENMLSANFRKVGIGAVSSSLYATTFVQLFSD